MKLFKKKTLVLLLVSLLGISSTLTAYAETNVNTTSNGDVERETITTITASNGYSVILRASYKNYNSPLYITLWGGSPSIMPKNITSTIVANCYVENEYNGYRSNMDLTIEHEKNSFYYDEIYDEYFNQNGYKVIQVNSYTIVYHVTFANGETVSSDPVNIKLR